MNEEQPQIQFQQFLESGVFRIQQCKECGRFGFPPADACLHCGAAALKWVEPSGRGVVYSRPVSLRNSGEYAAPDMAVVELEEGPRLLGLVMDVDEGELEIGMPVSAHIGLVNGRHSVVFYNKEQGSQEW